MTSIPITIITGYLGSGKTTLLRRIMDETNQKLAILMNEFGEIAVDAELIRGKAIDMIELAGGCVCCSLTGELESAIKEIVEMKPDRIIIETTGLAEPDAVVAGAIDIPGVILDGVITIVDAESIVKYPNIGHTGRVQIEIADTIILNKIDRVSIDDVNIDVNKQLEQIQNKIREINYSAPIFRTTRCDINTDMILSGLKSKRNRIINVEKNENHDNKPETMSWTSQDILDKEKFMSFVEKLPDNVLRAKGFVRFSDGSFLFNYVAGHIDLEPFPTEQTELVFIGRDLDPIRIGLERL